MFTIRIYPLNGVFQDEGESGEEVGSGEEDEDESERFAKSWLEAEETDTSDEEVREEQGREGASIAVFTGGEEHCREHSSGVVRRLPPPRIRSGRKDHIKTSTKRRGKPLP